MTSHDGDGDGDGWFRARKKPVVVEARGPYTDPEIVETLDGDFEVDREYIGEHGGFYVVRGVDGEMYPCAKGIFEKTYTTAGPTAVSDPNYLDLQSCDWAPDGDSEPCEHSPAAYVGDIYYACEDHFDDLAEWLETPSPIVHASDGPRLVLADGSVVRPLLSDADGNDLFANAVGQGRTIYGPEVDDVHTRLAFVDDPDATDIRAVRDRLETYGFDPEEDG